MVPPDSFLRDLQKLCRELGVLLILDEVQTGFGRTGRFFALEHSGLQPDILVMAKGMASGLPISAIAASHSLMERWPMGSHGGTSGANAIACAAANATLRVIQEEGLVANAEAMGRHLRVLLNDLNGRLGIGDVRGKGLMVGTEFGQAGGRVGGTRARALQRRCLERGLLLLTCGAYDNVIRWIPPLVITAEQVERAVEIIAEAVEVVR